MADGGGGGSLFLGRPVAAFVVVPRPPPFVWRRPLLGGAEGGQAEGWPQSPRRSCKVMALKRVGANCVLLVAKHGRTAAVLRGMAERIRQLAPKCEVLWEEHQRQRSSLSPPPPLPDLVISSGGDGTLLRAASYFPSGHAPTFLPVSGGSLGFMLPLSKKLRGFALIRAS